MSEPYTLTGLTDADADDLEIRDLQAAVLLGVPAGQVPTRDGAGTRIVVPLMDAAGVVAAVRAGLAAQGGDEGLREDVAALSPDVDVAVAVAGLAIDGATLAMTLTDGTTATLALPEPGTALPAETVALLGRLSAPDGRLLLDGAAVGRVSAPPAGQVFVGEDGVVVASSSRTAADDGWIIAVSGPEALAGVYALADAQIAAAAGKPIVLEDPTIVESPAGTFAFRDDGVVVSPEDDPATVVVQFERGGAGGEVAASGPTYTLSAVLDEGMLIEGVARYFNGATGQSPVVIRQTVQAATVYPNPGAVRAAANAAVLDLGGVDLGLGNPQRIAIAAWYRTGTAAARPNTSHLFQITGPDGALLEFVDDKFGSTAVVRVGRTGGQSFMRTTRDAGDEIGSEVDVVLIAHITPGAGVRLWSSVNGRPLKGGHTSGNEAIAAGASLTPGTALRIFGPVATGPTWFGTLRKLMIAAPSSFPDPTSAAFKSRVQTPERGPQGDRLVNLYDNRRLLLSAPANLVNAGTHAGTLPSLNRTGNPLTEA